jgi:hypothetical protein
MYEYYSISFSFTNQILIYKILKEIKTMEFYKKISIIVLVLVCITLLFAISLIPWDRGTVSINDTTEGGISGTIANASVEDTILLDSGNYTGENNTGITISKSITLKGNGPRDTVIIDAKNLTRIFTIENNLVVTFTNITFINTNATGNGGAINNPHGNTRMRFINCTFINSELSNTSDFDGLGGAIYNVGLDMSLIDCTFTNISTVANGGAIYNIGIGVDLLECNFTNIIANGSGGAIHNIGFGIGLTDCNFTNIIANGSGGAIHNIGFGIGLVDCSFTDILANGSGGAIYNTGIGIDLLECIFTNISADGNGGAIHNRGIGINLVNCNFTDIFAEGNGGAIENIGIGINLVSCIFTNILANGNGGAIYNDGVNVNSVDSIFTNINANGDGNTISGGSSKIMVG